MTDYRFGRELRVSSRRDISRVFEEGRKRSDSIMTLYAVAGQGLRARCAVAVSKRHGNAVRRNRIKRLCREAFRLTRHALPGGWDYVILPRVSARPTLTRLQASLLALAPAVTGKEGRHE